MVHGHRRRAFLTVAFLVLAVLAAGGARSAGASVKRRGGWQPGPTEYHPSRVIVRFADGITTSAATDSIRRLGYSLRDTADFEPSVSFPAGLRIGIVEIPEHVNVNDAVAALGGAPGILYAERDYKVYPDTPFFPNDPRFPETWGLHNQDLPSEYKDPEMPGWPVDDADIDAPEGWGIFIPAPLGRRGLDNGAGDVIVAVIDTGMYVDHPDLNNNVWRNPDEIPDNLIDDDGNGYTDDVYGWDFYNDDNTVFDADERVYWGSLNDEHGTHCAGTIGAAANNNLGVPGVCWSARIMSLKFIGPEGGYTSGAILAFQYAHSKGAKVISCSWGGGEYEQSERDAIEATQAIVCCSAGNDGADNDAYPHYPSSYDCSNIISVAASMQNEQPCNYPDWWATCYGATSVDLFAPGGYILSTLPPDPVPSTPGEHYDFFYGTSMATPHVSGAAALVHLLRPGVSLYQGAPGWNTGDPTVKDAILDSVDVKPAYQGLVFTGGRLNLNSALLQLAGPVITSIDAEPASGPPPLDVAFTAAATTREGEIVDEWWDFGDGSEQVHDFEVHHTYEADGKYTATFTAKNTAGLIASATVTIDVFTPPSVSWNPNEFSFRVTIGQTATGTLTLSNAGPGLLVFGREAVQDQAANAPSFAPPQIADPNAVTAAGPFGPAPSLERALWLPEDVGSVVTSWTCPESIDPWGAAVLYDSGNLVIGTTDTVDYVVTPEGAYTGLSWTADFGGSWAADMAFDGSHIWQVSVGGDNAIYKMDPATGEVAGSIWGPDWTNTSQRGLAYNPMDDTFYVGGWNEYKIYKIKGERWDSPGEVIEEWYVQIGVAGLAFHPAANILAIAGSGENTVYLVDGTTLAEVASFPIPGSGSGAGCEFADDGNLWASGFYQSTMYLLETGLGPMRPWLSWDPTHGTVEAGSSVDIAVTADAEGLKPGIYSGVVVLRTNDPENQMIRVPVALEVVEDEPPVASFSFSPSPAMVGVPVQFTDESTDDGTITAWFWEFGDESTSEEQNPKHTYATKGEFTVKLTVTDDGEFTGTVERKINVVNAAPTVKILKPEAGAAWAGERIIEWQASDPNGDALKIKLEYDYLGDAAGWQMIAENQANTGQYVWDTSKVAKGGRYKVRITAVDPDEAAAQDESGEFTIAVLAHAVVVAPNPARDAVTFFYDIPSDGTLYVYDIAGRLMHSAELPASANAYEWNLTVGGRPLSNGVYLYVAVYDGGKSEVGKLVVNR